MMHPWQSAAQPLSDIVMAVRFSCMFEQLQVRCLLKVHWCSIATVSCPISCAARLLSQLMLVASMWGRCQVRLCFRGQVAEFVKDRFAMLPPSNHALKPAHQTLIPSLAEMLAAVSCI